MLTVKTDGHLSRYMSQWTFVIDNIVDEVAHRLDISDGQRICKPEKRKRKTSDNEDKRGIGSGDGVDLASEIRQTLAVYR